MAILGGLVDVALPPFAAIAYFLSGDATDVPVWVPVQRPLLAPWLTFAAPELRSQAHDPIGQDAGWHTCSCGAETPFEHIGDLLQRDARV